jgi:serine/threonine protein kinase
MVMNPKPGAGRMIGHSIAEGRLEFTELIGVGTYGEVYTALDRVNGGKVAIKVLSRKKPLSPHVAGKADSLIDAHHLSTEFALHARIPPHTNIVRLERVMHTADQLFMILEHCPGGDLYDNIVNNAGYTIPGNDVLIRRLFMQMLDAIEHCHRFGVYHRDLKPENILITSDGLNAKIIDFGLATDREWSTEIGCGSAYYMSPECQGGLDAKGTYYASAPNDVWALGVILINLSSGRNPWNQANLSDPLFRNYLTNPEFLYNAINASCEFREIISRVFCIDPLNRCSIPELRFYVKSCPRFVLPPATAQPPAHLSVGAQIPTKVRAKELKKAPVVPVRLPRAQVSPNTDASGRLRLGTSLKPSTLSDCGSCASAVSTGPVTPTVDTFFSRGGEVPVTHPAEVAKVHQGNHSDAVFVRGEYIYGQSGLL